MSGNVAICLRYQPFVPRECAHQDATLARRGLRGYRDQKAMASSIRWLDPTIGVASRCPNGRPSSKVTSRLQRFIKSLMICSAVWVRSVEKMALGGRLPSGSRVSTQRMGKGSYPVRYHKAVPVHSSSVRSPSPYQSSVRVCQTVAGSCKTCSRVGRRVPTTRGGQWCGCYALEVAHGARHPGGQW